MQVPAPVVYSVSFQCIPNRSYFVIRLNIAVDKIMANRTITSRPVSDMNTTVIVPILSDLELSKPCNHGNTEFQKITCLARGRIPVVIKPFPVSPDIFT